MSGPDLRRLERIFDAALALEGDERRRYLDAACAGDVELRVEVERLLAADADPGDDGLLSSAFGIASSSGPATPPAGSVDPASGSGQPASAGSLLGSPSVVVGPFSITGTIGEGGMGIVY